MSSSDSDKDALHTTPYQGSDEEVSGGGKLYIDKEIWQYALLKFGEEISVLCLNHRVELHQDNSEDPTLCVITSKGNREAENAEAFFGQLKDLYVEVEDKVRKHTRALQSKDKTAVSFFMRRFSSELLYHFRADALVLIGQEPVIMVAVEELNNWVNFAPTIPLDSQDGQLTMVNVELSKWQHLQTFRKGILDKLGMNRTFCINQLLGDKSNICHLAVKLLENSSDDANVDLNEIQLNLTCLFYNFHSQSFPCSLKGQHDPEFSQALEVVQGEFGSSVNVVHEDQEVLLYSSRCTVYKAIDRLNVILGKKKVLELICSEMRVPKDYHQLWEEADLNIWEYVVQVKLKNNDKLRQNLKFYVQSGEEETCAVYYLVLDDGQKRAHHYLQEVQRFYELAKDNVVLKTLDHRLYATYSSELEETLSMFYKLAVRETHTEIIFIGCPPIPTKALKMFTSLVTPMILKKAKRDKKCKLHKLVKTQGPSTPTFFDKTNVDPKEPSVPKGETVEYNIQDERIVFHNKGTHSATSGNYVTPNVKISEREDTFSIVNVATQEDQAQAHTVGNSLQSQNTDCKESPPTLPPDVARPIIRQSYSQKPKTQKAVRRL